MEESTPTPAGQTLQVSFLPINRPDSPPQSRRRRAFQSCEQCRKRKSRCVPDKPGERQPCKRCVDEGRRCEFRSLPAASRRTTRLVSAGNLNLTEGSVAPPASMPPPVDYHQPMSPASTLVDSARGRDCQQLPKQAGSAAASTASGPATVPTHISPIESLQSTSNPTARSRIISARLHNTADALDLLTFTAAGEQDRTFERADRSSTNNAQSQGPNAGATTMPSRGARGAVGPRDPSDADWDKFVLVKRGVVSKNEVAEYLDFYFDTMWSLRPIVPSFYRVKNRYVVLAVEEPLLLVTLVTLASRYYPLSGAHGEIRSERIHWQAWNFLKRYLQSALWGSPYTRSPGAIAAMLLLMEWHPKSINNASAFDGDNIYDLLGGSDGARWETPDAQFTSLTSQQRYRMATLLEDLNIVAPAYRSNKMSWWVTTILFLHCVLTWLAAGCSFPRPLPWPMKAAVSTTISNQPAPKRRHRASNGTS